MSDPNSESRGLEDRIRDLERRNKLLIDGMKQADKIRSIWQDSVTELKKTKKALKSSEQRFDLALKGSGDGLWDWDIKTGKFYMSELSRAMLGIAQTGEQFDQNAYMNLIHPDDLDNFRNAMQAYLAGESNRFEIVVRLRCQNDDYNWILCRGVALRNRRGEAERFTGIMTDLSDRMRIEQQLKLGAQVMEATHEGVMVTNSDVLLEAVNPAFTAITGYEAHEVIGKNPSVLHSNEHDAEFFSAMWDSIHSTGHWAGEIWDRNAAGQLFPAEFSINSIRNEQGEVTHYVGIFSDITQRKAEENQLKKMAFNDVLTGLPNRTVFMDRLIQAVHQAKRGVGEPAVLFMDLDKFKQVNDSYGHDIGDLLLIEVTRRIREVLREEDTLARIGGDEFTAILRTNGDHQLASLVAQRIIDALTSPFELKGHHAEIGVSIGISLYGVHSEDPELLVKMADTAMYQAKENGRNRAEMAPISGEV